MKHKIEHFALLSPWIFYIGYLIFGFIKSEIGFFVIFPTFFMGIIAPFLLWETGFLAFILIIAIVFMLFKKWRYRGWILGVLQWGYLVLILFSMNTLANIVWE